MKAVSPVVSAALLGGLVLAVCLSSTSAQDPARQLGPYHGAVLRWKEDITLAAPVERQVAALHVEEGDPVTPGDVLMELDRAEAELAVAERRAAVARAEAEVALQEALLDESRAQLDAARYLRTKNAISEEEYRQAEVRVQVQEQRVLAAKRDLEQAKVALQQAELLLARHTIKSPIRGIVMRLFYRQGAYIDRSGQNGLRVCRLVRTDVIRAVVHVPLADSVRISRGAPVLFRLDMPQLRGTELASRTFRGRVTFLAEIDPVDGTRELWADIDNPDGVLQENMLGTLMVHPGTRPPTTARRSGSLRR